MRILSYRLKDPDLKRTINGSLTNILTKGNGASLPHMANYTGEICPQVNSNELDLFVDWALQNDLSVVVYALTNYTVINGDEVDLTLIERSGEVLEFAFCDAQYRKVQSYNDAVDAGELLESDEMGVYSSLIADQSDSFGVYSDHIESAFRVMAVDKQNGGFYAPLVQPRNALDTQNFIYTSELLKTPTIEEIKKKWLTIAGGDVECSPVETKAVETNNPINKTEKVEIMSKVNAVVNVNKTALVTAAKLEAGKIGLKQMSKLVQPAIPVLVRGYADTAMGRVALANIFHFAASNYAGGNDKVKLVADAMLEAAMVEFVGSFNIEEIFEKVIGGIDVSKLTMTDD